MAPSTRARGDQVVQQAEAKPPPQRPAEQAACSARHAHKGLAVEGKPFQSFLPHIPAFSFDRQQGPLTPAPLSR